MTVKELIERLQGCDPESIVTSTGDGGEDLFVIDVGEVKGKIRCYSGDVKEAYYPGFVDLCMAEGSVCEPCEDENPDVRWNNN